MIQQPNQVMVSSGKGYQVFSQPTSPVKEFHTETEGNQNRMGGMAASMYE
jgi:hypothetical protein